MDEHDARSRNILACLGDASRFRLVLSLLERERCVTELAAEVGLSQSCTTRHLQYLEREGLVRGARQGKRVMFQLRSDRARVRDLLAWVTAASPDSSRERTSGADLHTEGPRGRALAGKVEAGPAPGAGGEPARPSPEPVMDGQPLNPGRRASGTPGAAPRDSASDRHAEPESPDSNAAHSRQQGDGDMEDWLL